MENKCGECGKSAIACSCALVRLTDADRAELLSAVSCRARELGREAGRHLRTEMTESGKAELERVKARLAGLMEVAAKVIPAVAYLVGSEYETVCYATRDEEEFGIGGLNKKPVEVTAEEEAIPW